MAVDNEQPATSRSHNSRSCYVIRSLVTNLAFSWPQLHQSRLLWPPAPSRSHWEQMADRHPIPLGSFRAAAQTHKGQLVTSDFISDVELHWSQMPLWSETLLRLGEDRPAIEQCHKIVFTKYLVCLSIESAVWTWLLPSQLLTDRFVPCLS